MFELLHGTDEWTLGRWRCHCTGGDGTPIQQEIVRRHEVVLPVRGVFVRELSGREGVGCRNTALLADRGDRYRVRHPIPGGDRCTVILLESAALEDLARATGAVSAGSGLGFQVKELPAGPSVFLAAARLERIGDRLDDLAIESEVASLLSDLLEGVRPESRDSSRARHRQRRAVVRAMEFILTRYRTQLSLAEIAAVAAYSPFHFSRIFQRVTGLSPYRYVTRLRLREVAVAMLEGADDLSALAFGVGFSSHSHMTAAFRREFGCPPSSIRARCR